MARFLQGTKELKALKVTKAPLVLRGLQDHRDLQGTLVNEDHKVSI